MERLQGLREVAYAAARPLNVSSAQLGPRRVIAARQRSTIIVDPLCALAINRRGNDVRVRKLLSFFQFFGLDLKYQGLES